MNKIKNIFFSKKALTKEALLQVLYEKYAAKLCSYGMHTWKLNEDLAWDLVYKTLYKIVSVYENYSFENENLEQGFIFKTFINYIKNYFRDHKDELSQVKIELNEAKLENVNTSPETNEHEKLKILQAILDDLEDWQRILVLMRSDGRSYADIAEFVDKPENQLKVYYQRIKEQITKKIHETVH